MIVVPLTRRQVVIIAVLALVIVLFVLANALGARQPGGGLGSATDVPARLGQVLVLPAGDGDVKAATPICRQGHELTVAAGQSCRYSLQSGFLGKKLSLRLDGGQQVDVEAVQPRPEVKDSQTLDAGHRTVAVVYKQDHSTLTLACGPAKGPACQVRVA